jgi:hypothetical protein
MECGRKDVPAAATNFAVDCTRFTPLSGNLPLISCEPTHMLTALVYACLQPISLGLDLLKRT